jgi:DNA-binding transcriptional regulator YhcF (GntR family)
MKLEILTKTENGNTQKKIISKIRDLINFKNLEPGEKLPSERMMSEKFGVSRSNVREAIQKLELYGLLKSIPQSGTFIANIGIIALNGMIDDILRLEEQDFKFNSKSSMEKFDELLQNEAVLNNVSYLRKPEKSFILDFILSNYQTSRDFYVLHLITSFEALLEFEEYLYDFDDVLNHFLLSDRNTRDNPDFFINIFKIRFVKVKTLCIFARSFKE